MPQLQGKYHSSSIVKIFKRIPSAPAFGNTLLADVFF